MGASKPVRSAAAASNSPSRRSAATCSLTSIRRESIGPPRCSGRYQEDAANGAQACGYLRPRDRFVRRGENAAVLGAEGGGACVREGVQAEAVYFVVEPLRQARPAALERASPESFAVNGAPAPSGSIRSGHEQGLAAQGDAPAVRGVEPLGPKRPGLAAILADRQSAGGRREHLVVDRPHAVDVRVDVDG